MRSLARILLPFAAASALPGALPAQSHFLELQPSIDRSGRPLLADTDGDGDLDLLVFDGPPTLYLNDGFGNFRDDGTVRIPNEREIQAAAFGDLDGDGDVDLLAVSNDPNQILPTTVLLFTNDGTGRFTLTPHAVPTFRARCYSVALADVDGDRDLDLFLGRVVLWDLTDAAPDSLYLNDGQGGFTDASSQLPPLQEATRWAAFDDLDADGDLDLITASVDQQVVRGGQFLVIQGSTRAHLNDGSGTFATGPALGDQASRVTTFDAEGDGDRDLLTTNELGLGARIQLNDGTGHFTQSPEEFPRFPQLPVQPSDFVYDVVVDDVDLDGDQDVLLAWQFAPFPDAGQESDRLHLNDGTGRFTLATDWRDPPGSFPQLGASTAFAAGDVDGDGDRDLVGNARGIRTYRSVRRQLSMPFRSALGSTQQIVLRAEPTRATRPHAAFVALSPPSVPLPVAGLGTLWLQPGLLFEVATTTVPAPSGQASVALPVPNDPALEGVRFHVQALWTGDGAEPPRLSNAARGQIVR